MQLGQAPRLPVSFFVCLNFEESPDDLEVHEPGDIEREQEREDCLQNNEKTTDLCKYVKENWLGDLFDVQVRENLKYN